RMLVRSGLKAIRSSSRQGLFALANVSDLDITKTTAVNIGFTLGPRLNAAGRIESALAAFELLTTRDISRAGILAQNLNANNRKRQEITRDIQQKAEELAMSEDQDPNILFAVDREFNSGVVGLAASRLSEQHYRPAVVGEMGEETTRCSCRSIPEFHITRALDQCADLLVRHGGHAAAAGFTVKNENLPELKSRLKMIAGEVLNAIVLQPTLSADIVLPLSDLTPDLLKHIGYLQPTGYGNNDAVFVSRNLQVKSSRTVGADAKHLKAVLTDGKLNFDAIGFRLGHLAKELPAKVDIMYTFETNEFNGRTTLQLNLKDLKKNGDPDAG
ncbi:MAG: DHHA1 domain-containing protein, partial [Chloroflexota bacterium]